MLAVYLPLCTAALESVDRPENFKKLTMTHCDGHRNLSARTIMFELVHQTFLAKKLVDSLLISTLDKENFTYRD
jgi:hypothetical protein